MSHVPWGELNFVFGNRIHVLGLKEIFHGGSGILVFKLLDVALSKLLRSPNLIITHVIPSVIIRHALGFEMIEEVRPQMAVSDLVSRVGFDFVDYFG